MTNTRDKFSGGGGDVAPLPQIPGFLGRREENAKNCKCAHRKLSHCRGAVGQIENKLGTDWEQIVWNTREIRESRAYVGC